MTRGKQISYSRTPRKSPVTLVAYCPARAITISCLAAHCPLSWRLMTVVKRAMSWTPVPTRVVTRSTIGGCQLHHNAENRPGRTSSARPKCTSSNSSEPVPASRFTRTVRAPD